MRPQHWPWRETALAWLLPTVSLKQLLRYNRLHWHCTHTLEKINYQLCLIDSCTLSCGRSLFLWQSWNLATPTPVITTSQSPTPAESPTYDSTCTQVTPPRQTLSLLLVTSFLINIPDKGSVLTLVLQMGGLLDWRSMALGRKTGLPCPHRTSWTWWPWSTVGSVWATATPTLATPGIWLVCQCCHSANISMGLLSSYWLKTQSLQYRWHWNIK